MLNEPILLIKFGRIVVLIYNGDTINSVDKGDLGIVGTIPEEFMPRYSVMFCNTALGDNVKIQLYFADNGNIYAYNYGDSVDVISICRYNGVYISQN